MSKLAGKIALIAGGSTGIGLATAQRFVKEGAEVIITGRNEKALKLGVGSIGENVTYYVSDISKLDQLDELYASIKAKFGRIDILVANAGIGHVGALGDVSEQQYDEQFDVNTKGIFFAVQKALPLLSDGSSIVLTSSVGALKGGAAYSVYSASKAAVRSFARGWTTDLKDRKIRVNSLSPGPVETPIFEKVGFSQEQIGQVLSHLASQVPMGRVGQPEEIAAAILFLASDESSFITGVDLCVDGGWGQV